MPPRASSMPQPCPAVSPDQTNETERRSAGAVRKRPITGSPRMVGDDRSWQAGCGRRCPGPAGRPSSSALAVKSLSGSASTKTPLRIVLEAVGGRDLDQHARRPVGARPDHAGIGRHVAGLDAVGDQRPVGGAAEVGLGDAAGGGARGRGRGGQPETAARDTVECSTIMDASSSGMEIEDGGGPRPAS